jgi:dTDP-4-dehydrorhamnose reductase
LNAYNYKNILITGSTGNFGKQFLKLMEDSYAPTKSDMNITIKSTIEEYCRFKNIQLIIHCAAYTKKTNDNMNFLTNNIIGTSNLVEYCGKNNIKLIYISTDVVYSGGAAIICNENTDINPDTPYGWSKLGGECAVQQLKDFLILRGSFCPKPFPYKEGHINNYKNFIYQDEAADWILKHSNLQGVYNLGKDYKSAYDFGKETRNIKPVALETSNYLCLNTKKMKGAK